MPPREATKLRERADDELQQDMEEAHQALFNLRFQAATRQLADVSQVRKTRLQIARIKTLLREREIIADADQLIEQEAEGETADEAVDEAADADADADTDADDEE